MFAGGLLALDEREREYLRYETARTEFDDWITAASDGIALDGDRVVTVDSLEGLVDVAIDSDRRVVSDGSQYVVFGDGVSYRYDAPPAPDGTGERDNTDPLAPESDGARQEDEEGS